MTKKPNIRVRIPKYHIGRIFLFPVLLYFMLVFPVLAFMILKSFPELKEKSGLIELRIDSTTYTNLPQNNDSPAKQFREGFRTGLNASEKAKDSISKAMADSLTNAIESGQVDSVADITLNASTGSKKKGTSNTFSDSITSLFKFVIIFSTLIGFAVNLPFKRYFRRKRLGKTISPRLYRYCRRFLLYTPIINSGIVLLAFTVVHGIMIYQIQSPSAFTDEIGRRMFSNYLFISLVASLLTVLFIYFWQKHRVHIRYIEHIFTRDELQKRIFGKNTGKIRNRLYIASAMTTLLPLTIVLLYLILSLTPIKDMGEVSHAEMRIMLGRLSDVLGPEVDLTKDADLKDLYYISAFDNALMFGGNFQWNICFIYLYPVFCELVNSRHCQTCK
ncbi:MAG: hypothetical protein IPH20_16945 [Bacteroidales bacterium]|nr:hypothetical protein [Bacteroidales bacterium]